jgi:hypothetical protein
MRFWTDTPRNLSVGSVDGTEKSIRNIHEACPDFSGRR